MASTMTSTLSQIPAVQHHLAAAQPPPTTPLPALPIPKTRRTRLSHPASSHPRPRDEYDDSHTTSTNASRSVTPSLLPTPRSIKMRSATEVPTLHNLRPTSPAPSLSLPTPTKTLRKVTSIGAFPLPPNLPTNRISSLPPSPLTTPLSPLGPNGGVKGRTEHLKSKSVTDAGSRRTKSRSSGYGLRTRTSTSSLRSAVGNSPSLLNGTADHGLISGPDTTRAPSTLLSSPALGNETSSIEKSRVVIGLGIDETLTDRGRPSSLDTTLESGGKETAKGNVIVSVRVRPDVSSDEAKTVDGEWMVDGRRSLISYNGREGGEYHYDNVFSPHDHNSRVYDNAAKRLVRRVMEGYHGTVFAYGMTGTGKTFSMQGTATAPGVIPLAITDIFSYIRENPDREFLLRVSYLEIYNEKIHDLLSQTTPGQAPQEEIKLREDAKRGVYATPLKEEIVQSPNQLLRVIARGDMNRRTGHTQFNARSSRSHAVVQIVVESRERTPSHGAYFDKITRRSDRIMPGGVLVSTLSLIDLAGSERAAENKERRAEGAHINKSLLTLGTVIARLSGDDDKDADGKSGDKEKSLKHLPYRDSKLTRLLQPALSGNSLVSILCTIQISSTNSSAVTTSHTGETLNTLKFASRAKNNIVSRAKRNESNPNGNDPGSRALLDRYRMEIQDLRKQLDQQNKAKDEVEKAEEEVQDRKAEEEYERQEQNRHEEQMLEMQLARTALKERISHLNRLILSSKSLGVNSGRFSSNSGIPTHRGSMTPSELGRPLSVRSRDSLATLEPGDSGSRSMSALSNNHNTHTGTLTRGGTPEENGLDDEDVGACDADGDEHASLTQQNRMLQADLADKNRYIATLEKRLLQARRTSHSRVSVQISARAAQEGGMEQLLRDKEREIDDLKAKLDDQTRMVNALRSAARKRDMLESRKSIISDDGINTRPSSTMSTSSRMNSRSSLRSFRLQTGVSHTSTPSTATNRSSLGTAGNRKSALSPMTLLSPTRSESTIDGRDDETKLPRSAKDRRSVDEMTLLLDQMIQEKVESGHVVHGERGSLRVKRDTVMEGRFPVLPSIPAGNNAEEMDAEEEDGKRLSKNKIPSAISDLSLPPPPPGRHSSGGLAARQAPSTVDEQDETVIEESLNANETGHEKVEQSVGGNEKASIGTINGGGHVAEEELEVMPVPAASATIHESPMHNA